MKRHFKYLNLITCSSIEEFQIQCVLNSYSSMTVKQNIQFIDEAVKYSADLILNGNLPSTEEFSNYYIYDIFGFKAPIPIGLMTICDVIANSEMLDGLSKNSKFHKHIILKSYYTSTSAAFTCDLFKLILMHVLRKFPDLHKTQINLVKRWLYTKNDVDRYFSETLHKLTFNENII